MISEVLNILSPKLIELCWVENYAGLTRLVNKKVKNGYQTFPIICDLDKDCWSNGIYKNLVPNDKYKSTVYWEQISSIKQEEFNKRLIRLSVDLRLVSWFNLNRLGKHCSFSCEAYEDLLRVLLGRHNGDGKNIGINISNLNLDDQDTTVNKVFGRYSYDRNIFIHPYEAMSVTMSLSFVISKSCLKPATCENEIPC